ncbi:MAG TPA: fumarylacetoacetate hydrolase family protein [Terriglobia bacterium]|nr:fumarylacetoacetate hydrolase family protein [Terriglobia bacterium]
MKLVTYELGKSTKLGVVVGERVMDVRRVVELIAGRKLPRALAAQSAFKKSAEQVKDAGKAPLDMIELLGRGEKWLKALGRVTSALAREFTGRPASKGKAEKQPPGLILPLSSVRLRHPIQKPGKITCVGLNYADHALEQGIEPPKLPIFFLKSGNTVSGPGDPIVMPPNSSDIDYEAEFAVVIGKRGKQIPEEKAYDYVAGYMVMNDVTARDMQHGDKQWFRGKSCDTFAPAGPWIVTKDEIPDPHQLSIKLELNGEIMQDSSTSNLIFKVPFLVSYLSQSLTWEVGDIISTGTPPGVGVFRKPPIFLKAGDTVSAIVERLGTLTNPVVAAG